MLAALDVADAPRRSGDVAAQPGGLGDEAEHDVREPARITLREAMAAAADRDSIASEYASGYSIVFEFGLPLLVEALSTGHRRSRPSCRCTSGCWRRTPTR